MNASMHLALWNMAHATFSSFLFAHQPVLWVQLCPPKIYIEALSPSNCEQTMHGIHLVMSNSL